MCHNKYFLKDKASSTYIKLFQGQTCHYILWIHCIFSFISNLMEINTLYNIKMVLIKSRMTLINLIAKWEAIEKHEVNQTIIDKSLEL